MAAKEKRRKKNHDSGGPGTPAAIS